MKKRNFIAKDLLSKKYKPRIIKPKNVANPHNTAHNFKYIHENPVHQ